MQAFNRRCLLVVMMLLSIAFLPRQSQAGNYPYQFHTGTTLNVPLARNPDGTYNANLLVLPTFKPYYGCARLIITPSASTLFYASKDMLVNLGNTIIYANTHATVTLLHQYNPASDKYTFLQGFIFAYGPGTYSVRYDDLPSRFCPPPSVSGALDEYDMEG
jgi:hypothetical protein